MSQGQAISSKGEFARRYNSGEDRYVRFATEILGLRLAETQKRILRAVENNKRVVIVSGNGVGKSYAVACLNLAFLYCNLNSTVVATSGSYTQLTDSTFKPMKKMLSRAQDEYSFLPGKALNNPPRIEFEGRSEQYFKAISPRNPGGLEGRHNHKVLVVCDESDKPEITPEHFDSAGSSITDSRDRFVVIGNPPEDESNSLVELMESDRWEVIQFSSFDSHNVMVDAGVIDDDKIPGLVDLQLLKEDWEDWNDDPWPSFEDAKNSENIDSLDTRWYRRRLGVIPPDNASAIRPIDITDVVSAENNWDEDNEQPPIEEFDAVGVDIARGGGDRTVISGACGSRVYTLKSVDSPGNHNVNRELVESTLGDFDGIVVVDAVGEGSGVADMLSSRYYITRFNAGENAKQDRKYYDKRTESLVELGKFLQEGGTVEPESELSTELRAVSRVLELEEKDLRGGSVFSTSSKDEVKKSHNLGRSPDLVDAASMAVWGARLVSAEASGGYGIYSYN